MSAPETTTVYIETTIPPGMTLTEYRRSRPRQLVCALGCAPPCRARAEAHR